MNETKAGSHSKGIYIIDTICMNCGLTISVQLPLGIPLLNYNHESYFCCTFCYTRNLIPLHCYPYIFLKNRL